MSTLHKHILFKKIDNWILLSFIVWFSYANIQPNNIFLKENTCVISLLFYNGHYPIQTNKSVATYLVQMLMISVFCLHSLLRNSLLCFINAVCSTEKAFFSCILRCRQVWWIYNKTRFFFPKSTVYIYLRSYTYFFFPKVRFTLTFKLKKHGWH